MNLLFFGCEFFNGVSSSILQWLGIDRITGGWQDLHITQHLQANSGMQYLNRMILFITIYFCGRKKI